METANPWIARLGVFIPDLLERSAGAAVARSASIVLHGSTCRGVDDQWSDLDLWVCVEQAAATEVDRRDHSRVIDFELCGKVGHCNVEGRPAMRARLRKCDVPMISEWRTAMIMADPKGWARDMQAAARIDMPAAVRLALFRRDYLLMRQAHRTADNPLERNQSLAALQSIIPAVTHALRAAMTLDGEPYPYDKWLTTAASATPTGAQVAALAESLVDTLRRDTRSLCGPERDNPLSQLLRRMRAILLETAAAAGIQAPWLRTWWHEIEHAMEEIQWPC